MVDMAELGREGLGPEDRPLGFGQPSGQRHVPGQLRWLSSGARNGEHRAALPVNGDGQYAIARWEHLRQTLLLEQRRRRVGALGQRVERTLGGASRLGKGRGGQPHKPLLIGGQRDDLPGGGVNHPGLAAGHMAYDQEHGDEQDRWKEDAG